MHLIQGEGNSSKIDVFKGGAIPRISAKSNDC